MELIGCAGGILLESLFALFGAEVIRGTVIRERKSGRSGFEWIHRHAAIRILHAICSRTCRGLSLGFGPWTNGFRSWRSQPTFGVHEKRGGDNHALAGFYSAENLDSLAETPSGLHFARLKDAFAMLDINALVRSRIHHGIHWHGYA